MSGSLGDRFLPFLFDVDFSAEWGRQKPGGSSVPAAPVQNPSFGKWITYSCGPTLVILAPHVTWSTPIGSVDLSGRAGRDGEIELRADQINGDPLRSHVHHVTGRATRCECCTGNPKLPASGCSSGFASAPPDSRGRVAPLFRRRFWRRERTRSYRRQPRT